MSNISRNLEHESTASVEDGPTTSSVPLRRDRVENEGEGRASAGRVLEWESDEEVEREKQPSIQKLDETWTSAGAQQAARAITDKYKKMKEDLLEMERQELQSLALEEHQKRKEAEEQARAAPAPIQEVKMEPIEEPERGNPQADEVVIAKEDECCQLEKGHKIEWVMAAGEYEGIKIVKLKYHGIAKPEWVELDIVNQYNPQAIIDAYKASIPNLQQDEVRCNGEPL